MIDKKIIDYGIVGCVSPLELAKEVKRMIKDGWTPTGGICTFKIFNNEDVSYTDYLNQAMVKYSHRDDESEKTFDFNIDGFRKKRESAYET